MDYFSEELKHGIKIHYRNTNKYKTNLVTIFLSVPLNKQTVTKNALITSILRLGTKQRSTQEEISKKLEEMYGAEFNCGVEKIGEVQLLKFYIEVLNDEFLPQKENLLEEAINQLLEIIFNPITENDGFLKEYIETEKVNLKNIIESKINDKDQYSFDRCIEEMYKDSPYSIYKYGYVEDLEKLTAKDLYNQYKELIKTAKIDIYVSGKFNQNEIKCVVQNNPNIQKLLPRTVGNDALVVPNSNNNEHTANVVGVGLKSTRASKEYPSTVGNDAPVVPSQNAYPNTIEEKQNVTQGKLVIGLDVNDTNKDSKYVTAIYNVILGASATSKLFQNVREKASLAYSARSVYVRQKNNIYIRCGIEIGNYDKAMPIIYKQLDDMKNGDFTEEDIESAKKTFVSAIKAIQDEQDAEITYFISQELTGDKPNFAEYEEKIKAVTKEQVQDIANKISVNTVYFLRN